MRKGLWPRIYRERRRLALVTLFAFAAGFLFYIRVDIHVWGLPVALVTGAIYAAVIGPVALAVCLFLPSLRFMIEAVAVARLGLAVFVLAEPGVGYRLLASPMLTAAVVVGGGWLISRALHGRIVRAPASRWRDRFLPRGLFRRDPARLAALPWQRRFVGWVDDTLPAAA